MPVPALAVIGGAILLLAFVIALQILERRRLAARDEAFTREAAMRGWRYSSTARPGTRWERWQGAGLAGPWSVEITEHRGRKRPALRVMRWWNGGADAPGPTAGPIILLLPIGDETRLPLQSGALGTGVLGRMAEGAARMALAMGVDHHFGPLGSIQGRTLERLDADQPMIEGFAVLADPEDEARRRLTPDLVAALRRAFPAAGWPGRAIHQPWVTVHGDRVAIACVSRLAPTAADVAALVEAGTLVAGARG